MPGNFLKGTVGTEPSAETKVFDKKTHVLKDLFVMHRQVITIIPPKVGNLLVSLDQPNPGGHRKRWNNFCWFSSSKEKKMEKDWKAGYSATTSFQKMLEEESFPAGQTSCYFWSFVGSNGSNKIWTNTVVLVYEQEKWKKVHVHG